MGEQGLSESTQRRTRPVRTADWDSSGLPSCSRDNNGAAGNLSQASGERSESTGCLRHRRDLARDPR
jgi:hypothetical protein